MSKRKADKTDAVSKKTTALVAHYPGLLGSLPNVSLRAIGPTAWMQAVQAGTQSILEGFDHVFLFVGIRGMDNEQVRRSREFCDWYGVPCSLISKAIAAEEGIADIFPDKLQNPPKPMAGRKPTILPAVRYTPPVTAIPQARVLPTPVQLATPVQKKRKPKPRKIVPPIVWPYKSAIRNTKALEVAAYATMPEVVTREFVLRGVRFYSGAHLALAFRTLIHNISGPQLRAEVLQETGDIELAHSAHVAINYMERLKKQRAGKHIHLVA